MAAAPDTRELYPLTTPAGDAIPFEVFRPFGLLPVAITDAVSADITIPDGAELFLVYATIACIMRFGETNASVPASGTHQLDSCFIPSDTHMVIDPNAAAEFTIIGTLAGATGVIYINTTKRWKDLQIETMLDRT